MPVIEYYFLKENNSDNEVDLSTSERRSQANNHKCIANNISNSLLIQSKFKSSEEDKLIPQQSFVVKNENTRGGRRRRRGRRNKSNSKYDRQNNQPITECIRIYDDSYEINSNDSFILFHKNTFRKNKPSKGKEKYNNKKQLSNKPLQNGKYLFGKPYFYSPYVSNDQKNNSQAYTIESNPTLFGMSVVNIGNAKNNFKHLAENDSNYDLQKKFKQLLAASRNESIILLRKFQNSEQLREEIDKRAAKFSFLPNKRSEIDMKTNDKQVNGPASRFTSLKTISMIDQKNNQLNFCDDKMLRRGQDKSPKKINQLQDNQDSQYSEFKESFVPKVNLELKSNLNVHSKIFFPSSDVYSKLEELTQEEMEEFKAPYFTPDKIPYHPPPREFCM